MRHYAERGSGTVLYRGDFKIAGFCKKLTGFEIGSTLKDFS
jgi:hypothetical protein